MNQLSVAKRVVAVLAVGTSAVVTAGCGAGPEKVSAGGAPDKQAVQEQPHELGPPPPETPVGVPVDRTDGMVPGERVPVINERNETGFVAWDDMMGISPKPVVPITDEAGTTIAYYGHGYGWITIAEYESPDFSLDDLIAEHMKRVTPPEGLNSPPD